MILLLKALAYVPYWGVVFVGSLLLLAVKDEDAAHDLVDFAKAFWDSWR